jgi:hypothetical protein
MGTNKEAEKIADRYLPQIRFTSAYFDENYPVFPACLSLEIPTQMLREYATLKNKDLNEMQNKHIIAMCFLTNFWLETGLAKKLISRGDAAKVPDGSSESPKSMLEYLLGENIQVELSALPHKRDFAQVNIEIEVYDTPNPDEDELA